MQSAEKLVRTCWYFCIQFAQFYRCLQDNHTMAPVFSSEIISRVKDESDIVEVVSRHVDLKAGGSVLKGLCPFHKEKTPSFIVTPARQTYHCFGCATGGDVISFLMEIEGVTFPEAVEILARPLDIDLSAWLREDEDEGERRAFHRANETAVSIWQEALWDPQRGSLAAAYLTGRGFTEKVLRDFDVGYAGGDSKRFAEALASNGVDKELAVRADLMRVSERDGSTFAYFRNRVVFPIRGISRQVVGFGGRVFADGEPKYLNSADSSYFSKGKLLYGFDASRMPIAREKSALLVEGYLDFLALAQVGINNVVATCGTAFTPDQARLIKRSASDVVLVFDGDKAGLKAAVRSADVALKAGLEPKIVRLPDGEDPASLVIDHGPEAMASTLRTGLGYIPFLKMLADENGGEREVTERALRQVLGTASQIEDPIRREYVLQEAADVFGLSADLLRDTVAKEAASKQRRGGASKPADSGSVEPAPSVMPAENIEPEYRDPARPRVRINLARARFQVIEKEVFACILADASGVAARIFAEERGTLPLRSPGAEKLSQELVLWVAEKKKGNSISPGEFITERWNIVEDKEYRGFVSELLAREESPQISDHVKVVRDCLVRLNRDHVSRQG